VNFPVSRLALARTVRLVASARLRDPVLARLATSEELLKDLSEIEGATSGRLMAQHHGTEEIVAREFVVGVPHAAFINASFSYWLPRELNRFNGPGRGAWYAALDVDTALAEVTFHVTRHLVRTGDFNATVEFAELFASFAGEFVDLRGVAPIPDCLGAEPAAAYPEGIRLAADVRAVGQNGIIYPSVGRPGGACLVALWPHAVQSVTQGDLWRASWRGSPVPAVERL
jgi:RES domain-containing protein